MRGDPMRLIPVWLFLASAAATTPVAMAGMYATPCDVPYDWDGSPAFGTLEPGYSYTYYRASAPATRYELHPVGLADIHLAVYKVNGVGACVLLCDGLPFLTAERCEAPAGAHYVYVWNPYPYGGGGSSGGYLLVAR